MYAKFTPTIIDSTPANIDLTGGVKAGRTVTAIDGATYLVETTVDDDPFTLGTQIDATKSMKEITLKVTPQGATGNSGLSLTRRKLFFAGFEPTKKII